MLDTEVRDWVGKLPSAKAKRMLEGAEATVVQQAPLLLADESLLPKWPALLAWLTGRTTAGPVGCAVAAMLENRPAKVWKAAMALLLTDGWAPVPELGAVIAHRLRYDPDPKRRAQLVQLVLAGRVPEEAVPALLEQAAADNATAVSKLAADALSARGVSVANPWDACPLAPAVIKQLRRLGATYTHPTELSMEMQGHAVPAPIVAFARGVRFPPRSYRSPESARHWVWSCRFNLWGWLDDGEVAIANRDGRPLAYIAHADGGNTIVVLALDSSDPTNPRIDVIDHYDPEQRISCRTKLSEFLTPLRAE